MAEPGGGRALLGGVGLMADTRGRARWGQARRLSSAAGQGRARQGGAGLGSRCETRPARAAVRGMAEAGGAGDRHAAEARWGWVGVGQGVTGAEPW
jgi:hypothetical protein